MLTLLISNNMLILLNVMGLTSVFGALSQETLTFFNLDSTTRKYETNSNKASGILKSKLLRMFQKVTS